MRNFNLSLVLFVSSMLLGSFGFSGTSVHYCTADGYSASGALISVSGEEKGTIEEAEESAIKICRNYGLSVCQIASCFSCEGVEDAKFSSER